MDRNLKVYYNIFFVAYLLMWVGYVSFLLMLTFKTIPGFVMQLIFLAEGVMNGGHTLKGILFNEAFAQSIVSGLLVVVLSVLFVKGLYMTRKLFVNSRILVQNLPVIGRVGDVHILNSPSFDVFTSGFFKPQISISKKLYDSLKPSQLEAVLLHEESHVNDIDPLRSLIVRMIDYTLPPFPSKHNILYLYNTVVELKCDSYAEMRQNKKRPLVEALYKIVKERSLNTDSMINFFVDTPERIPILLGVKKLHKEIITSLVVIFVSISVALPVAVYSSNFYNCDHVIECIRLFADELKNSSPKSICENHTMTDSSVCTSE